MGGLENRRMSRPKDIDEKVDLETGQNVSEGYPFIDVIVFELYIVVMFFLFDIDMSHLISYEYK